ncbi:unnamed protein product [Lupinus luteus]|uniref:Uncharacterized protein n=1 Tax=Lupinus luteus TaxID=3873 RepID=A0AAV1WPH6_LUPLU
MPSLEDDFKQVFGLSNGKWWLLLYGSQHQKTKLFVLNFIVRDITIVETKTLSPSLTLTMTNGDASHALAGGKVNISAGGATPLHIAADNGSLELINCLFKAGTDLNISD